jgi:hypothetical protein
MHLIESAEKSASIADDLDLFGGRGKYPNRKAGLTPMRAQYGKRIAMSSGDDRIDNRWIRFTAGSGHRPF